MTKLVFYTTNHQYFEIPIDKINRIYHNDGELVVALKDGSEFCCWSVTFEEDTPLDAPLTEEEQMLMEIDDRIDDYLKGRMLPEEELAFIQDCHADEELKHRAYTTALLVKALNKK